MGRLLFLPLFFCALIAVAFGQVRSGGINRFLLGVDRDLCKKELAWVRANARNIELSHNAYESRVVSVLIDVRQGKITLAALGTTQKEINLLLKEHRLAVGDREGMLQTRETLAWLRSHAKDRTIKHDEFEIIVQELTSPAFWWRITKGRIGVRDLREIGTTSEEVARLVEQHRLVTMSDRKR